MGIFVNQPNDEGLYHVILTIRKEARVEFRIFSAIVACSVCVFG